MLLIQNGNVYLGAGRYEKGWDVLCDGSIIKAIGPDLDAPAVQDYIDAEGRDVYPGFVLGLCSVGAVSFSEMGSWDIHETAVPAAPHLNIRDAFDLRELKLQRFGRAGITSYGLTPGTRALLAGQMALIHVDGERTGDVFLADNIAVKGNYTETVKKTFKDKGGPATRMAMYQALYEALRGAKAYLSQDERKFDAAKEALGRVLRREIPLVMAAHSFSEMESVMRIAREFNLRLVLTGAFSAAKAAEQILAEDWHVFLGDSNFMLAGVKNATDHAELVRWYRKGLNLSIFCSGDEAYPPAYEQLLWVAAQMSIAGAEGYEIVDMMTIQPARALGVEHLVGSLEVGKQADLVISRGNPALRFDNYVDHTIVAGRSFYVRKEADYAAY